MANITNFSHVNLDEFVESLSVVESSTNYLRIFQWNIRGMNDLSKFDTILETLDQCKVPIDVVVIGETWVKKGHEQLYNIPGFNSVFSCRDNSNGGLAVFVRTDITFTVVRNFHSEGFHHICVEISTKGRIHDVHSFYRPPSFDVNNFINKLEDCLDNVNRNHSCFFVGDVNIPINAHMNNVVVKYKTLLESYGFACTNSYPTRPISSNILDHIICKIDDIIYLRNDTILTEESDHCMIITSFKLSACKEKSTLTKTIVDHQNVAMEFGNFLENIGEVENVNVCLVNIVSTYKNIVAKYSKIVTKKVSIKNSYCPWMNFNLWSLIRLKNNYIKRVKKNPLDQHLKNLLKHISAKVITAKKQSKRIYYDKLLNNTPHSKVWKHINNIFGKSTKSDTIALVENGVKIENNQTICEVFNNYFSNIGQHLADNIQVDTSVDPLSSVRRVTSSIFLNPASSDEVTLLIKDLERNKSPGPDGISVDIIKNNHIRFSSILADAFNKIVETGLYPECLKISRVVPIYKSGDACDASNYRPISTLSIFNKILEKLLINRIIPFLNQHNVFYNFQYGFRQGSSTATATVELLDDIIKGIDTKQVVGALFLDLRKAFDTLDHNILLRKLEAYGIRGVANEILSSYLKDRKQFVAVGDSQSSLKPVKVGVPQGSNIGPILFLLYINDLSELRLKGTPRLFADDTALFYPNLDVDSIVEDINEDLRLLSKYFSSNLLSLNISKTKYMIFHSPRKNIQQHSQVWLDSYCVEKVTSFKYLGLILDSTLSWADHIKHVEKKVSSFCGVLRRVSYFVSRSILLKFYFAHIHSCLSYLVLTWGRASKSSLMKLQTLQNRCLKTIFNKPFLFPTLQLYSDVLHNILPIHSMCKLQTVIFVHDTLHNNKFHYNIHIPSVSHNYSTRRANNLYRSRAFTMFGQKRISIIGPMLFNQLPEYIKLISDRNRFKFKVKQYMKSNLHDILG